MKTGVGVRILTTVPKFLPLFYANISDGKDFALLIHDTDLDCLGVVVKTDENG